MDVSDVSIEITGSYLHLRSNLRHDGRYFLDLNKGERIPTYEDISSIDPKTVDVIAAYGMDLAWTDANVLALSPFLDAAAGNTNGVGIDVYVQRAGERLPFTKMFVKKIDDSNRRISVELQLGYDFWVQRAENLPIYKIPFPPLLFTTENVKDLNENHFVYVDGENVFTFPYVNYGRTYVKESLQLYDLRPFVSALGLLRLGFANINHAFNCPFLESDFGRHLGDYLLKDDYGNNVENNKRRNLTVILSEDISVLDQQTLYNNIPFNQVVDDPGLAWNFIDPPVFTDASYFRLGSGFFGTIQWGFTIDFEGKFESLAYQSILNSKEYYSELWIKYPANRDKLLLGSDVISWTEDDATSLGGGNYRFRKNIAVKLEDQEIPPDSYIYVKIHYHSYGSYDMTMKAGAYLQIIPTKSIYSEGDTIQMYNELDHNISLMDMFRATSHFICGKVYYNYAINQVLLLAPFESEFFEETIPGFFKSMGYELIDIDKVVPDSLIKTSGDALGRYYLTTGYARSTDPAITNDTTLTNDVTQVFDSRNIIGQSGAFSEAQEDRNPLFEPTVNKPYNLYVRYGNVDPELDRYPLDMPYLTDNESTDGTPASVSFNIKPRRLYINGYTNIRVKSPDGMFVVPGSPFQDQDGIPMYAFDYPNAFNVDESPIDRYFAYGTYTNDLFTKFWKEYLRQQRNNIPYQFLAYVSQTDNKRLNFRERILVNYMGTEILGRLTKKEDYDGGVSGLPNVLTFYPYRSLKQHPASDDEPLEIRTTCDSAKLFIQIDEVDGCYTASLGGSSSSSISNVIFKYKLASDTSFTLGDEICDPSEAFTFSMQVEFTEDECIDFYITQSIEPCQNEIRIVFTLDPISGCLTIGYDPLYITSTVDTVTIVYELDGGGELPYTVPICDLEEVSLITAKINITFEGGCDPLEATLDYPFPPTDYDCTFNEPELDYIELNNCQILPQRTGVWINAITIIDVIQYKYAEDGDYEEWDGSTPLDKPVWLARAMVFDGCESILIPLFVDI